MEHKNRSGQVFAILAHRCRRGRPRHQHTVRFRRTVLVRAQTRRDAAAIGVSSVDGAKGHRVKDQETVMRALTTVIAALGVLGVVTASGPARAHDDNGDGDWRRQE